MLKYILIFAAACVAVTPLYMIIRRPWRAHSREQLAREWLLGLFTVFMIGMLYMTFRGVYDTPVNMLNSAIWRIKNRYDIILVPFRNIRNMYLYDDREHFIMNILGNTVMFMPWGFFRPLLWRRQRTFGHIFFGALALTVFIETFQLFIFRTVDIDDIILNTLGSLLGALLFAVVHALFPKSDVVGK